MAQKTGNEDTEFKVATETIGPCIKCGVSANSAANNLCQKCFTSAGVEPVNHVFTDDASRSGSSESSSPVRISSSREASGDLKQAEADAEPAAPCSCHFTVKRAVNRCSGCSRKVGLAGFRCRCGYLFCAEHRYSDRHDCSYDYKAAGREMIAKENPVVKAAKIIKI